MAKKIKVKPGKAQSKFSMFFGLIFVCIGIFVAIPVFGPFGILWTCAAAFIVYANYRNGFTDKPISTHEIIVEESDSESIEERLKTLESLYNQRLITKEEYDEKRKQILNEI